MSKTGKKILAGVGGLFILGALGTTAAYFASDKVQNRFDSFLSELKDKNTSEVQKEVENSDADIKTYKFDCVSLANKLEELGVTEDNIIYSLGSGVAEIRINSSSADSEGQFMLDILQGFYDYSFQLGNLVIYPNGIEVYIPAITEDIPLLQYLRKIGTIDTHIPKLLGEICDDGWQIEFYTSNGGTNFEYDIDSISSFIK